MPKVFTSKTQKIGEIGEKIACEYLVRRGYFVMERNYTKPWGEIDIIAKKDKMFHFIEVKSVSREIKDTKAYINKDLYRPEENLSRDKLRKIYRTVSIYLKDNGFDLEKTEWQVGLICVYLDHSKRLGKVTFLKSVI